MPRKEKISVKKLFCKFCAIAFEDNSFLLLNILQGDKDFYSDINYLSWESRNLPDLEKEFRNSKSSKSQWASLVSKSENIRSSAVFPWKEDYLLKKKLSSTTSAFASHLVATTYLEANIHKENNNEQECLILPQTNKPYCFGSFVFNK